MSSTLSDLEFLSLHTRTLFENRERIQSDPELAAAYSPEIRISVAYTTGGGMLPLGLLLELWTRYHWCDWCPSCRGRLYIHRIGGSPLSGNNAWRGVCIRCGKTHEGSWRGDHDPNFHEHGLFPVTLARKRWNVSESFAWNEHLLSHPEARKIEILGGMVMDSPSGPIEMQIGFGDWSNLGQSRNTAPPLQATIPLQRVLKRLKR